MWKKTKLCNELGIPEQKKKKKGVESNVFLLWITASSIKTSGADGADVQQWHAFLIQ